MNLHSFLIIPCHVVFGSKCRSQICKWAWIDALTASVLIMADNLGWGELGCYGGGVLRGAPTPRIDELAKESLMLQNYNVEVGAGTTIHATPSLTGTERLCADSVCFNVGPSPYQNRLHAVCTGWSSTRS